MPRRRGSWGSGGRGCANAESDGDEADEGVGVFRGSDERLKREDGLELDALERGLVGFDGLHLGPLWRAAIAVLAQSVLRSKYTSEMGAMQTKYEQIDQIANLLVRSQRLLSLLTYRIRLVEPSLMAPGVADTPARAHPFFSPFRPFSSVISRIIASIRD